MNYICKQLKLFFIPFFLCCVTFFLTACVDLSGAKLSPEKKVNHYSNKPFKKTTHGRDPKYQGEVHALLGGLGMFSVGMNDLRNDITKQYKHVSASSNIWYNAGDVSHAISDYYFKHKMHRPIILMGHSLGANEQIKVARNLNALGIPVALLVTVDAVSQTIVPPNVKHVLNIYKPGYVPMFSGLKLRALDPQSTVIENVNIAHVQGVSVNHFTIDKDKAVQAMILAEVKKVLIDGNKKRA